MSRFKRIAAALAVMLVAMVSAVALTPGSAFALPPVNTYIFVIGIESQKCMTDHGGDFTNGTDIDIFTCLTNPVQYNQVWKFIPYTNGQYFVQMQGTNKCLTVRGGFTANGTRLELWDCLTTPVQSNQLWQPQGAAPYWQLVGLQSQRCATVHGGGSVNNTPMDIWDCLSQGNQFWTN